MINSATDGVCSQALNVEQLGVLSKISGRAVTDRQEQNKEGCESNPLRWLVHAGPGTCKSHRISTIAQGWFENGADLVDGIGFVVQVGGKIQISKVHLVTFIESLFFTSGESCLTWRCFIRTQIRCLWFVSRQPQRRRTEDHSIWWWNFVYIYRGDPIGDKNDVRELFLLYSMLELCLLVLFVLPNLYPLPIYSAKAYILCDPPPNLCPSHLLLSLLGILQGPIATL